MVTSWVEVLVLVQLSLILFMFVLWILFMLFYREPVEEQNVVTDYDAAWVPPYQRATLMMVEMAPQAYFSERKRKAAAVKLGYFPYSAEGTRASEERVCAICLEAIVRGEMCGEVPACRHLFHRDCIDAWTKNKTTCPLCRARIVTGLRRSSLANAMV
jgi:hypothetical protein